MKKKLVTADDYRMDRDYWKKRALNQQKIINSMRRREKRLSKNIDTDKEVLQRIKKRLREVCPHDELEDEPEEMWDGGVCFFCHRCTDFIDVDEIKDRQQ